MCVGGEGVTFLCNVIYGLLVNSLPVVGSFFFKETYFFVDIFVQFCSGLMSLLYVGVPLL